jgi:hypothetical protein
MNATLSPDRATFRQAVAAIAATAHARLPLHAGRIDSAVKLVLLGEVTLLPDGTATVGSCSDPTKSHTVNGTCTCRDYAQAPGNLCKHRLAYGIARRAQETLGHSPEPLAATVATVAPLPEAPASANVRVIIDGREVQVTLRGTSEEDVLARVEKVLARYPAPTKAPQAQPQGADTPRCPDHGTMKQGKRGWYCPRKLDDGSWCQYKTK